jgi:hypothetical protein
MQADLDELKSVVIWIREHTDGLILPAARRYRMVFGCLDLAIEHQAGVSVLADQEFWGPAFALLRPLLDSVIRGLWLASATDSDLDLFERGGLGSKKVHIRADNRGRGTRARSYGRGTVPARKVVVGDAERFHALRLSSCPAQK